MVSFLEKQWVQLAIRLGNLEGYKGQDVTSISTMAKSHIVKMNKQQLSGLCIVTLSMMHNARGGWKTVSGEAKGSTQINTLHNSRLDKPPPVIQCVCIFRPQGIQPACHINHCQRCNQMLSGGTCSKVRLKFGGKHPF